MRMIANSLVTTSLVVIAAFSAVQARAADLDAASTVDAVTESLMGLVEKS